MTRRSLKQHATGTSPSVEFKFSQKNVFLVEVNAGFGTYRWGNIKAALVAKRQTEDFDTYFMSKMSVPSPGGNHASIVSWHGVKYIDSDKYTLKVVGRIHTSDTLYVEIVIETDIAQALAGAYFDGLMWVAEGGLETYHRESVTFGNNNQIDTDVTIPAGEVWDIKSFRAINNDNVTRTLRVLIYSDASLTDLLEELAYDNIGTTETFAWPNSLSAKQAYSNVAHKVKLVNPMTIRFRWLAGGASAGAAADADAIVINYTELRE